MNKCFTKWFNSFLNDWILHYMIKSFTKWWNSALRDKHPYQIMKLVTGSSNLLRNGKQLSLLGDQIPYYIIAWFTRWSTLFLIDQVLYKMTNIVTKLLIFQKSIGFVVCRIARHLLSYLRYDCEALWYRFDPATSGTAVITFETETGLEKHWFPRGYSTPFSVTWSKAANAEFGLAVECSSKVRSA